MEIQMSHTTVEGLIEQIQKLSEEDRLLLETRLSDISETEWQKETTLARQEAKKRNIDQKEIDNAVYQTRYSS
jgi:hypothetical protein